MPKKLALVLASLIATNSFAQTVPNELLTSPNSPVVTVGGYINFTGAGRVQDKAYSQDRLPDSRMAPISPTNPNPSSDVDAGTPGTHNRYSNKYGFVNDAEIYIKVGAINEYGLKYGGVVQLEASISQDATDQGLNASRSFVFTESQVGRFEFGNNLAANQKMKVGPSTFARAAGGINGKYLEHINFPMYADSTHVNNVKNVYCVNNPASGIYDTRPGITSTTCNVANLKTPNFIVIPQSPIAHGGYAKGFYSQYGTNTPDGTSGDYSAGNTSSLNNNRQGGYLKIKDGSFGQGEAATKVSYYTPRINDLQFGLSYTPDTGDNGTSRIISGSDTGDVDNVFSGGLNYSKSFGNLGLATSATFEEGQFEQPHQYAATTPTKRNNLMSYDLGVMATYFGFTLGASYGSWGKSLQPKSGVNSCEYDPNAALFNTTNDQQNCTSSKSKPFKKAGYYTLGAAYEMGPFATSLTYLKSNFQNNQYQAASLGVDYRLAKGLLPYFEVTRFKFQSNQPQYFNTATGASVKSSSTDGQLKDNAGYVMLLGMLLAF